MSDQRPKGRIAVTVVDDTADASTSARRATVAVDDIMSVTEPVDGSRRVRIVLMEQEPSDVPWVFRSDAEDEPQWRVIMVSENYDVVQSMIAAAEWRGGLWSEEELIREKERSITLQEDLKVRPPIRFRRRIVMEAE